MGKKGLLSGRMYARDHQVFAKRSYNVHCMEDNKNALLAQGYIPIIMGGGITGDLQINDTLHSPLESVYRQIPSTNRNHMVRINNSQKSTDIDVVKGFKFLFVTNKFDRSRDMVSDAVLSLELVKLWLDSEKDY